MNYCRQIIKQYSSLMNDSRLEPDVRKLFSHVVDLSNASVKFLLPEGGRLIDDTEYRALNENEALKLPFPFCALEYHRNDEVQDPLREGEFLTTKAVVFARERDDAIVVLPVVFFDQKDAWLPMPEVAIPKIGFLDRSIVVDGFTAIRYHPADPRIPAKDYADEAYALMCFLNALQCSNVKIQSTPPRKANKKSKTAIPFDTYHVLTVDVGGRGAIERQEEGSHRSPREHLRRGHVRRYESGLRVWVNATVVNSGRGLAKVTKDYRMKCSKDKEA